jgi:hypothetical protein
VGQTGGGKGEGSEDDEVEIGCTMVSLRCPLSGSRIRMPARFASVGGLNAFDLDTFLDVAQRTRKWQCPHSMRSLPVQQLMVDGFLSCILSRLAVRGVCALSCLPSALWQCMVLRYIKLGAVNGTLCGREGPRPHSVRRRVVHVLQKMPDVMEIEVSPSGDWRVAGSEGAWLSVHGNNSEPLEDIKVKADPDMLKQEAGVRRRFPVSALWIKPSLQQYTCWKNVVLKTIS